MWKAIVLAAALGAASFNPASAQSVDPDGANRGYPAYAEPNSSTYYMGRQQGGAAGRIAAAPQARGLQSRAVRLQNQTGFVPDRQDANRSRRGQ